jgi:CubicO group peptidase (beta-lactamase class C family)
LNLQRKNLKLPPNNLKLPQYHFEMSRYQLKRSKHRSYSGGILIRSILLTLLLAVFVQHASADQVDRYMRSQMAGLGIPGASVGVIKGGKLIKSAGYGFANLELKSPATPETVYELGSLTKQFTAAAVMLLVEEGKVDLNDSVTNYFPDAPASWKGITVRHLLTHTSGIQNHVGAPGFMDRFKTDLLFNTSPSLPELTRMFYELPLEFEPGETWAYDNTGFILLGLMIEKVSGKDYFTFLSERLFKPLGMNATVSTNPKPITPNRASGYDRVANGTFENRGILMPGIALSAGSVISTVSDMAKWHAALNSVKILKPSSLKQMWSVTRTNDGSIAPFDYGFGWFIDDFNGHRIVQHSGGTPGFSTVFYRFIDDDLAVIVLTNRSDWVLDQLAIDIAGMYVPSLRRSVSKVDVDQQMTAKFRTAVAGLLKGEIDNAVFTKPMNTFLRTTTGKGFWQWFKSFGELRSFEYSSSQKLGDSNLSRYKAVMGSNHYWVTIVTDRQGKIAQIRWS